MTDRHNVMTILHSELLRYFFIQFVYTCINMFKYVNSFKKYFHEGKLIYISILPIITFCLHMGSLKPVLDVLLLSFILDETK